MIGPNCDPQYHTLILPQKYVILIKSLEACLPPDLRSSIKEMLHTV